MRLPLWVHPWCNGQALVLTILRPGLWQVVLWLLSVGLWVYAVQAANYQADQRAKNAPLPARGLRDNQDRRTT